MTPQSPRCASSCFWNSSTVTSIWTWVLARALSATPRTSPSFAKYKYATMRTTLGLQMKKIKSHENEMMSLHVSSFSLCDSSFIKLHGLEYHQTGIGKLRSHSSALSLPCSVQASLRNQGGGGCVVSGIRGRVHGMRNRCDRRDDLSLYMHRLLESSPFSLLCILLL